MDKISIIIPIYNAEKFLNRCIDSVLAQTYTNFELILVNDGSTDKSDLICNEYRQKDSRVKYIKKTNEGVSIARNTGISNSCGEYITFVDADDFVSTKYLEALVMAFKKENTCLAEIGYDKNILPNDSEDIFETYEYDIDSTIVKYLDGLGYVWGKLFLRKIINNNNLYFSNKLIMAEDLEFLIRYCCCISGKCISVKNKLYCYCDSDGSITRGKNYKKLKQRLEAGRIIKQNLLDYKKSEDIIMYIDKWIIRNIVWVCYDYFYDCNTQKIKLDCNELESIFNYINYVSIDFVRKDKFYVKYLLLKKFPNIIFGCYKFKKMIKG